METMETHLKKVRVGLENNQNYPEELKKESKNMNVVNYPFQRMQKIMETQGQDKGAE